MTFLKGNKINLGRKFSKERRKEMSESRKLYFSNPENREKQSETIKKWHKKKGYIPAWNKGLTKETDKRVDKYSNSLIGHKGAFTGKKRPEHSKMMKGRKFTVDHKRKISQSNKNNPFVIHHINGNHFDDRLENRQVMTRSNHTKLHNEQRRIESVKSLLVK